MIKINVTVEAVRERERESSNLNACKIVINSLSSIKNVINAQSENNINKKVLCKYSKTVIKPIFV